jgi:hypothetical protein
MVYRLFVLVSLLFPGFLMGTGGASPAGEPTPDVMPKDEKPERQESKLLSEIIRRAVPTARVNPILKPGVIILRGKVASQEDAQKILSISRTFGAGPYQTAVNEMVVDPSGILALELGESNVMDACLKELAKFMNPFSFAHRGTTSAEALNASRE